MWSMESFGTQGCWRVKPANPYIRCGPGLAHGKYCHLSPLLRWKPVLPATGRHQHGSQTAGFWQASSPQEWEQPYPRPPQLLIKRGHTVSSVEEATFTSFYSSLRLPEGVVTELLAEVRFRKWLLVCLLSFCRCSELRPGLGWGLGSQEWARGPACFQLLAR